MKTFCLTTLIGVFLLICTNGVQAQPTQTQLNQIELMKGVSGSTKFNTYQNQLGFENFQDFFTNGENHKIQHPKKLNASKVNQLKSAFTGVQKLDSTIYASWDITTSQWVGTSKTSYYYSEHNSEIPAEYINVYPNPASEYIVFYINNISESATVEIFNNQ
jgi:hypothetical protein